MTNSPKQIAVKVEHLTKTFKIPTEASNGIKQKLINTLKGKSGYRKFTPLKDISFEIEKGDFFGIVGRNGSGKSTLLKSIANIYTPTKGGVQVNGTLVPFIELGVGFNPELTGRENVFLNGALLGFSHAEMEAMYDDIVDFAEIGDFMDERLKNYSSGMQVRLAFSIAIKAEGDILLLDEVLAVGDEAFQRKCYKYFNSLKNNNKTVILVTHDMGAVREYCNKAILLEKGKIVNSGNAIKISREYSKLFDVPIDKSNDVNRWGNGRLRLQDIFVELDGQQIKIDFKILCKKSVNNNIKVSYKIKDQDKRSLFGDVFKIDNYPKNPEDTQRYQILIDNILSDGKYHLDMSIYDMDTKTSCDVWIECSDFSVSMGHKNNLGIKINNKLETKHGL